MGSAWRILKQEWLIMYFRKLRLEECGELVWKRIDSSQDGHWPGVAVTQARDNEVSGSKLVFVINLVLFTISLANLEDVDDVIRFLEERV